MFGFLIGFASLFGLFKVLRWGRHGGHCGHYGRHGGDCAGHRHRRRGRSGPGRWLDYMFERLDTSPGQEKEIRDAVRELMEEAESFKGELGDMKRAATTSFGPALFDEGPLDDAFHKQDEKLARMRVAVKHAMQRIHEALDERQRRDLSAWLERLGPRFAAPDFGPYR